MNTGSRYPESPAGDRSDLGFARLAGLAAGDQLLKWKFMRALVPLFFALASVSAAAEVSRPMLEIKTRCLANSTAIELHFEIRNLGDRTVWIYQDTEPWSPAFISNRFSAQAGEEAPQALLGPLAFGHSVESVKVLSGGAAKGVVQLHHVFPEILRTAVTQPVRLSWRWQGLASFSERFEEFSPTAFFEGSMTIRAGGCDEFANAAAELGPVHTIFCQCEGRPSRANPGA
ncbi:hypothetical protein [Acidovorax sp. sic0104]|uniref:hypothetical protein n=1 Tax=Acidovorax sp. sic0104 TaxID=2854784 RepID=UPI001C45D08F|nr:hypothetical protein [Acidovorax sp. sic0104]MBV7541246.1 hypothetical protein [Acidovorax sp. sic0104]